MTVRYRINSLAYEMNMGGGSGIFLVLQLLFYAVLTVRYYTTISLFLDSVHQLRSNKATLISLGNNS